MYNGFPKNQACEVCGETFLSTAPYRKYCCRECSNRAKNEQLRKRRQAQPLHKDYQCVMCGRMIRVIGTRYGVRKYCEECLPKLGALGNQYLQNRLYDEIPLDQISV